MTSGRLSGPHGSRRRACQCRAESLPTRAHPHHEGLAWRSGALALWICVFPGKNGLDARTTRLLRPQQHHSRADTITSIASRLTCRDDSAYAPLVEAGRADQITDLGRGQANLRKSEYASCDKLARQAIFAWRACAICPSYRLAGFGTTYTRLCPRYELHLNSRQPSDGDRPCSSW